MKKIGAVALAIAGATAATVLGQAPAYARPMIPFETDNLPKTHSTPCGVGQSFPGGPLSAVIPQMERRWGLSLTGEMWRDQKYRPLVQLVWETLDGLDCTGYLKATKAKNQGRLELSATKINGWAFGDWGYTKPDAVSLDFDKFLEVYHQGDRQRLVRLVVHEIGHAYNVDREGKPRYWAAFEGEFARTGPISAYGRDVTESWGDAVGYYVARCARDNPYNDPKMRGYYERIKTDVFGGAEFGPPPGVQPECG